MEAKHRPVRQAANAPPQITCASRAGDLGKETAGSQDVDEFAGHLEEIPTLPAREGAPETGPSPGEEQQAAGGEILPVEDRLLSHWPVPRVDEEQAHSQMLVVPVPDPDLEHLFKDCPHWKA
jgi:hypothetical protein